VAVTLGIADQTAQSGKILKERPTSELLLYLRRYLCGPRGVSSELRLIVSASLGSLNHAGPSKASRRLTSGIGWYRDAVVVIKNPNYPKPTSLVVQRHGYRRNPRARRLPGPRVASSAPSGDFFRYCPTCTGMPT
jgi:hypothetical protein